MAVKVEVDPKPPVGTALVISNDYDSCPVQRYFPLRAPLGDSTEMAGALRTIGFETTHITNVSRDRFVAEIEKLVAEFRTKAGRFVCLVFCGHGEEKSLITEEGLPIPYMDVIDRLARLADKVKLLFIDACRGRKRDEGVNIIRSRGVEHVPIITLPAHSNFLVAYSSVFGYESQEINFADAHSEGLWFPLLSKSLTTEDDTLINVLVNVTTKMHKKCRELGTRFQTAEFVSNLTERVNLFRCGQQKDVCDVQLQQCEKIDMDTHTEAALNFMLRVKELTLMSTRKEFNLEAAEVTSCDNITTGIRYYEANIRTRCTKCTVLVLGSSPKFCGNKHQALYCAWVNLFACFERHCLCAQNQDV